MALLGHCWLMVESFIIPNGLVKWFYLSFYIHPFFLVFCQFFLWFKWFFVFVISPLKTIFILVASFVKFCIFSFLNTIIFSNSPIRVESVNNHQVIIEEVFDEFDYTSSSTNNDENFQICDKYYEVAKPYSTIITKKQYAFEVMDIKLKIPTSLFSKIEVFDIKNINEEVDDQQTTSFPNDHISKKESCVSFIYNSKPSKEDHMNNYDEKHVRNWFDDDELMMNSYSLGFKLPVVRQKEEVMDAYYKMYTERMRVFDVLNQDTTCGISAILHNQYLVLPSSELVNYSPQYYYLSPNRLAKKRLIRNLESDFELVYVAQSCLSWEALQHQYRKIKTLQASSSQSGRFEVNVAGEFQKFRVFLNRFLEDEGSEGKRISNYVRGRFSAKSLIQVPALSGFCEEENEYMMGEGSTVDEVLGAIENCIETFWEFIKSDNHKSWWKPRALSTVEDPRDLEILIELSLTLRKKEILMKDLQGKARCWLRRVVINPTEESERKDALLAMVDMKLVSRVLHMSTLSSSQLKWCQQKLQNIEFQQGKLFRTCTTTFFPT